MRARQREQTIRRLAEELSEHPDVLLALAGKVSSDLLEIIHERPTVVAELLHAMRGMSAKSVSAISARSAMATGEPFRPTRP